MECELRRGEGSVISRKQKIDRSDFFQLVENVKERTRIFILIFLESCGFFVNKSSIPFDASSVFSCNLIFSTDSYAV